MIDDCISEQLSDCFGELARATDERFRRMTVQERDRMLQIHLAQCRGAKLNGDLLCEMTAALIALRRANHGEA